MSQIARELKMLFYLNSHISRNVKISELADLLEVTPRQVRRYRDDLDQCGFYVLEERGPNGGYKLEEPLDKSLMIPDNIMLALNIAAKNNESLIKSLKKLPVVPKVSSDIICDNRIFDDLLDKVSIIWEAKEKKMQVAFHYIDRKGEHMDLWCTPYMITFTNHTYYLIAAYLPKNGDETLVKYDIDNMSDIRMVRSFRVKKKYEEEVIELLKYYGIKNIDDEVTRLVIRYNNESILKRIDRLFDYKGTVNEEEKTYTVFSKSENELFYPLFSLGTKDIEILDEKIKKKYINYLENQLIALKK